MGEPVGEYTSSVSRVSAKVNSFRTSVPQPVAAVLGVDEGVTLVWTTIPGATEVAVRVASTKKAGRRV